jgi:lipocalin
MFLTLVFLYYLSTLFEKTPTPVSELNQTQYLGRWYQAYSDAFVDLTFENSSYCVTADYALNPNGTISVLNRERQYNISGPERRILGWADTPDPSKPGELSVHLQTTNFPAPYYVYELGPPTFEGNKYQYAVVSDPFELTLFVLARNLTTFQETWSAGVLERLNSSGFVELWNTPIQTVQEGCTYWEADSLRE